MRSYWRAFSFVTALSTAILVVAATSGLASSNLVQISNDPYHTRGAQHHTEVEASSAMFGSTIVSAFQVGRIFNGGATNIGWATSTDGGATWTHGFLPGITPVGGGTEDRGSDAAVAYDARHGVWMISVLGVHVQTPNDVLVSRSTDGLHWDNPVLVFAGASQPNTDLDKDWITCDNSPASPFYGHCYEEFDNFVQGDLTWFSTSKDGGLSWGPPKTTVTNSHGFSAEQVVQPNGRVVAPLFGEPPSGPVYQSIISNDGGKTWSRPYDIAPFDQYFEPANIRNLALPSVTIDASGRVYVIWHTCQFESHCGANDVAMSTSLDGKHWSPVQWIPIDPIGSGVDHFTPAIGANPTTSGGHAHLAITYYYVTHAGCHVATCLLNVGFLSSTDGGRHWSAPEHLAGPMNLGWLPATSSGYMYGDYIGTTVATDDSAAPIIAVAHPPGYRGEIPSTNALRVPMYTAGVRVTGGILPARTDLARAGHSSTARAPTTAN